MHLCTHVPMQEFVQPLLEEMDPENAIDADYRKVYIIIYVLGILSIYMVRMVCIWDFIYIYIYIW